MTAVAASFTQWSNRHFQYGGDLSYAYTAGQGQNDIHQRWSNADARTPDFYAKTVGYRGQTRLWTNVQGPYYDWLTVPLTATLSGTITAAVIETAIVTGGKTLIITLTGDTWIAAGPASFDLQRQNIINGITSAQSEALGWNLVPKALQGVAGVVRTDNTTVTITWDAFATYNITAPETITVTVPATALTGALAIIATPNFTVDATATDVIPLWQQISFGSFQTYGLRV